MGLQVILKTQTNFRKMAETHMDLCPHKLKKIQHQQ